ncbi:copper-binding protein [Thiobacillus sedimenti]|uniref:Copper-binding protein n=1 Tax=Thiobacillus sedimenti TaxID=3110231 RepID=A0ABZ1CKJ3_9PROT|nr:copper-binding protein [Thiobacillus sp. SCUT-2]WRS39386.1 copper-binding protein [Thiobacillus sp. SCUT-2]
MKKTLPLTLAIILSLGAGAACADSVMPGMDMGGQQAKPGASHQAVGVVKKVDAKAGKITLAHGAVKSLNWPPMTMPFRISRGQAETVRAGQRVNFEFVVSGMDATITKIEPAH